jgi:hypothetical protein
MGCLSSAVDHISSQLAFFPPTPSYEVKNHRDGAGELYIEPVRYTLSLLGSTFYVWSSFRVTSFGFTRKRRDLCRFSARSWEDFSR